MKRSVSSPRARACSLAPSSPKRATRADAGQLRHRADRAQPEAGEPGPDVGVAGEQAGGIRGEEPAIVAGRDEDRRAALGRMGGGDAGREARAGDPRPRRAGQQRREGLADPGDERLLDPPQPGQPVDVDGEPPERRVPDVARAGDPGAERRQPLAGGLDGVPVRLRREVEEGRLGCQPVGAPERDPPAHAEGPCERVRVDHRPVRPGLSAEDDRAGRPRGGGAVAPR